MELDYVHRSRLSDLSPVADIAWVETNVLFVAFRNGLIELLDVEKRELITSFNIDGTILGLTPCSSNEVIVQTKSGAVSLYRFDAWKCMWTLSTKTAASFAKPVFSNGTALVVSQGQSTLSFINIETGYSEKQVNVCDIVPLAKGMVVSMENTKLSGEFLVLMESGHLIFLNENGSLLRKMQASFPNAESSVPTALWTGDDFDLVGFSCGHVRKVSRGENCHHMTVSEGVGALSVYRGNVIVGSWRGELSDFEKKIKDQPHGASIVKLALDCDESRLAVASTDGRVSLFFTEPVYF